MSQQQDHSRSPVPPTAGTVTTGQQQATGGSGNAAGQTALQLQQAPPVGGGAAGGSGSGSGGSSSTATGTGGAAPSGPATGTSNLDKLQTAAEGSWYGNVDEDEALRLINALTPAEKASVRRDNSLMQKLAGAFDETEIVTGVSALGFELKWKAHWIDRAGETGSVPEASWQMMIAAAPAQEIMDFVGWVDLFNKVRPSLGASPFAVFGAIRSTPAWTHILTHSPAVLAWLNSCGLPSSAVIEELANPGIADASLPGIVAAMRTAALWGPMVAGLPNGSAVLPATRIAMFRFVKAIAVTVDEARELFHHRFNHDAVSSGANWTLDQLKLVWENLETLPDQDVSDNTVLTTFQAINHTGAFGPSWENTAAVNTIQIGDKHPPALMAHTVRHEVGHAVHAQLQASVNPWLQSIGFWFLDAAPEPSLRGAIADLGGFPATYTNDAGAVVPFGQAEQATAVDMLKSFVGTTPSWDPTRASVVTAQAADKTAIWNSMPAGVQGIATKSPGSWYAHYKGFQTGPKGKYFLNYWYHRAFYMSATAEAAVDAIGDNYTAMSEKEFFANCYAEYFKEPGGYVDHNVWGGRLPGAVKDFFKTNILERQPYTPPAAAPTSPAATGAGGAAPGNGGGDASTGGGGDASTP
jgi:hypothetical protein